MSAEVWNSNALKRPQHLCQALPISIPCWPALALNHLFIYMASCYLFIALPQNFSWWITVLHNISWGRLRNQQCADHRWPHVAHSCGLVWSPLTSTLWRKWVCKGVSFHLMQRHLYKSEQVSEEERNWGPRQSQDLCCCSLLTLIVLRIGYLVHERSFSKWKCLAHSYNQR